MTRKLCLKDGWIMTLLTQLLWWCGTELPWDAAVAMSAGIQSFQGEEPGIHTENQAFHGFC